MCAGEEGMKGFPSFILPSPSCEMRGPAVAGSKERDDRGLSGKMPGRRPGATFISTGIGAQV